MTKARLILASVLFSCTPPTASFVSGEDPQGDNAVPSEQATNSVADLNALVPTTGSPIDAQPIGVATGLSPNQHLIQQPNKALSINPNAQSPNATNPDGSNPNVANPNVTNPNTANPNGANPNIVGSYTPVPWPNIAFHDYMGKLGKKVVALTFDDGPDSTSTSTTSTQHDNTHMILDYLKANDLKATFFVCGNLWANVATDANAQATIKRMVAEGHDIGSHTYDHPHLDSVTPAQIDNEFAANLAVVQGVFGKTFQFTKLRMPYGFPYQSNNPNVSWVAPVQAKYGISVGWGIDTDDWKCAGAALSSNCIMNNLEAQVQAGHSGPILMHMVYRLTVETLPSVVAYLKAQGYTFVTVEQMIVDKYGASSATIMEKNAAANFTAAQISAFAVQECAKNQVISVPY